MITLGDGTHATTEVVLTETPIYFPETFTPRVGPRSCMWAVPDGEERKTSAVVDIAAQEVRVWLWLKPEDVASPSPSFNIDDYFSDIEGWKPLPED